jgi:hypothetical protein
MRSKRSTHVHAPIVIEDITITPKIHKDGDWYAAVCPEVPEANGQGRTPEKSVQDLKRGVLSIMQNRRADAAKNCHCVPEPA